MRLIGREPPANIRFCDDSASGERMLMFACA
jgi:hypothetical protein